MTILSSYHRHLKANPMRHITVLGLSICLGIVGCSDTGQTSAIDDTAVRSDTATTEASSEDTSTVPEESTTPKAQEGTTTVVENQPVQYNVSSWSKETIESFAIDDLEEMQNIFGKVTMTDENSLDYASNTAIKYRFMEGDKPYLDIIDSQDYLEFGWYYANPNDSDEEKKLSISHAKKVYQAAQGLMGEEGAQLVESMLNAQIIKDKEVGGQQVALAKCEFYSCMLILKKTSS